MKPAAATRDRHEAPVHHDLIVQLVSWVEARPRSYREAMDAWPTSCPQLAIWEDAVAARLVEVAPGPDGLGVRVTPAGRALLRSRPRTAR